MPKPTKEALRQQVQRGGRVFLFTFPSSDTGNGCDMPSDESLENILDGLADHIPGVNQIGGPYINGVISIIIDDTENSNTDEAVIEAIATVIRKKWRY